MGRAKEIMANQEEDAFNEYMHNLGFDNEDDLTQWEITNGEGYWTDDFYGDRKWISGFYKYNDYEPEYDEDGNIIN